MRHHLSFLVVLIGLSVAGCELALHDDDHDQDPCSNLDLVGCRADSRCVADTCLNCSCTPSFAGCRGVDASPEQCPDLECAQPACCRTQEECAGSGFCTVEPQPGCGACLPGPSECAADGACAAGWICEPIACSCTGERHCVPGCATTGCGVGEVCNPTSQRCEEQPCTAARTECPPNFACTWPEGGCLRLTCATDEHCPAGFCALGLCHESLGTCFLPPP